MISLIWELGLFEDFVQNLIEEKSRNASSMDYDGERELRKL